MNTISFHGSPMDAADRFLSVRQRTMELCAPLTAEDMMVQSCPEASPTKWHLAHTAWFFESFVLKGFLPGYRLFNAEFPWLFNSYYRSFAPFPEKRLRASFSRPPLEEVLRYREYVDLGVERLLSSNPGPEVLRRIELGVNHEEQHQELLLTDILHAFFTNPLRPAYLPGRVDPESQSRPHGVGERGETSPLRFVEFAGGLRETGHQGEGFCYDNELPRHRVWLEPFSIATRLVTCGEYAAFMADGGYQRPDLWLSAGWDAVKSNSWRAPLYWTDADDSWSIFTLRGDQPLSRLESVPVSHICFFEADAYARWAGHRLPTELEWEVAAEGREITGNLLDSGRLMPAASMPFVPRANAPLSIDGKEGPEAITQQFGDCWEWTSSAYLGFPGFQPPEGALGEYNGKFMSGQMVLRGGSCVTPAAHIRSSYRNFFVPETHWQFSGIRLARL